MHMEIGSNFITADLTDKPVKENWVDDCLFAGSGRTVIDVVIKDILKRTRIDNAYLPSYCCDSMIRPFLDNGINVKFYSVRIGNHGFEYSFPSEDKYEIIVVMGYFGFQNSAIEEFINHQKAWGKIVLEDATHSIMCQMPYSELSDYVVASIRKWTGLACGAIAIKKSGRLSLDPGFLDSSSKMIGHFEYAGYLKRQYLEGHLHDKEHLKYYSMLEEEIEARYVGLSLPEAISEQIRHIDIGRIRKARRNNAIYLYEGLSGINGIKRIFGKPEAADCPLFYPIMIKKNEAADLRELLINNEIYCPNHWPISEVHTISEMDRNIYEEQISLVCDQRYSANHMRKIVDVISGYFS